MWRAVFLWVITLLGTARAAPSGDAPLLILPIAGPSTLAAPFEGELARALRARLGDAAITTASEIDLAISAERTKDVLGCTDVGCLADLLGALGGRYALGVTITQGDPLSDIVVIVRDLQDAGRTFRLERRVVSLVSARLADLAADIATSVVLSAGWGTPSESQTIARPSAGGTLRIASQPQGALLRLNANPIGNAPVDLSGLASGIYVVQAIGAGYAPLTRTLTLEAGEEQKLDLSLTPLRDWQAGAVFHVGLHKTSLRQGTSELSGSLGFLGGGGYFERELFKRISVGGYLGYSQVRWVADLADGKETYATWDGMQIAAHASVGTAFTFSQVARFGLLYEGDGPPANETERLRREIHEALPVWPSMTLRLRAKLIYQTPSFLQIGMGAGMGFFGVLHFDIAYTLLLFHPSTPLDRNGYEVQQISRHGVMFHLVLGYTSHRHAYFDGR